MTIPFQNLPDTRPGYAFQSGGDGGALSGGLEAVLAALIQRQKLDQDQQALGIQQQQVDQMGAWREAQAQQQAAELAARQAAAQQTAATNQAVGVGLGQLAQPDMPVQMPFGALAGKTYTKPAATLAEVLAAAPPAARKEILKEGMPLEEKRVEERAKRAYMSALPKDLQEIENLRARAQEAGLDKPIVDSMMETAYADGVSPETLKKIEEAFPVLKGMPPKVKIEFFMDVLKDRAKGPSSQQQGIHEERIFRRMATLADDYYQRTKVYRDAHRSLSGGVSKAEQAAKGNGAAQVQMLYAFIKAFDPTSVVREGEIALAQRAAPIWTRAKAYADQIAQNKAVLIPPLVVNQMRDLMSDMLTEYEGAVDSERDALKVQGRAGGLDDATLEAALPALRNRSAAPGGRPKPSDFLKRTP